MLQHWEDSSPSVRGLLKAPQGFKAQIKSVVKVGRNTGHGTYNCNLNLDSQLETVRCREDISLMRAQAKCLPSGLTCSVQLTGFSFK